MPHLGMARAGAVPIVGDMNSRYASANFSPGYDSRISSSRRPSPFKSFFTALEAAISP